MFTMKYSTENGSSLKIQFDDGWQRIRHSNSAYFHKSTVDDGKYNALRHTINHDSYFLCSYAAPIMWVHASKDEHLNRLNISVCINEELWQYSRSTIRHISDFCRLLSFWYQIPDDELSYLRIKKEMKSNRLHFFLDGPLSNGITRDGYKFHIHLYRETNDTMRSLFAPTPKFTVRFI